MVLTSPLHVVLPESWLYEGYNFYPNIHSWKKPRGCPKNWWADSIKHDSDSAGLNITSPPLLPRWFLTAPCGRLNGLPTLESAQCERIGNESNAEIWWALLGCCFTIIYIHSLVKWFDIIEFVHNYFGNRSRYIPRSASCVLMLKFRLYPAIHTNYSLSNCTI